MTQARQEKLETSIDCVLFDLDGTLIDTAPDFTLVVNKLLEEHDKMPLSQEVIHLNVSNGARALVKNAFNIDETHDDFSGFQSVFFERLFFPTKFLFSNFV